jgi:hypothetical protein
MSSSSDESLAKGQATAAAAGRASPNSVCSTESHSDSDAHEELGLPYGNDSSIELLLPSATGDQQDSRSSAANSVVVHVPSTCACGCVVIGVWYCKVAYYCEWFRHPRYRALRTQLELKRRLNNDIFFGKARSLGASNSSEQQNVDHEELDSAKSQPSLGPEVLTLLCTFQLLRHKDALLIREICATDNPLRTRVMPSTPSSGNTANADGSSAQVLQNIKSNENLKNIDIASLLGKSSQLASSVRAHIDSVKSQSFVHFRWCAHIPQLCLPPSGPYQSSGNAFTLGVVGCSDNRHWRRKHRDQESMITGASLVRRKFNIAKVLSPFEVAPVPVPVTAVDATPKVCMRQKVVSWESCDEHVWTLARQLCLVTEQQQIASMATEFPESLRGSACHDVPPCTDHCLYMNNITPTPIIPIPKSAKRSEFHFGGGALPPNSSHLDKKIKSDNMEFPGQTMPMWPLMHPGLASTPSANSTASSLMLLLQQQQMLMQMQQQQASSIFSLLQQTQAIPGTSDFMQFMQGYPCFPGAVPATSSVPTGSAFQPMPLMQPGNMFQETPPLQSAPGVMPSFSMQQPFQNPFMRDSMMAQLMQQHQHQQQHQPQSHQQHQHQHQHHLMQQQQQQQQQHLLHIMETQRQYLNSMKGNRNQK